MADTNIESTWTYLDSGSVPSYKRYPAFTDNKYVVISDSKSIDTVGVENYLHEQYSQYIPFEMNRFYDGVDLAKMSIKIHYITPNDDNNLVDVVNVSYNDKLIHFGWIIDDVITAKAGKVRFEIQAVGSITDVSGASYSYLWKSKPNGTFEVFDSLETTGISVPSETEWYNVVVTKLETAVQDAQDAAKKATAALQSMPDYVDGKLKDYATTSSVDDKLSKISSLKNLVVKFDSTNNQLNFYDLNGATELADDAVPFYSVSGINTLSALDVTASRDSTKDSFNITFKNGNDVIKSLDIDITPSSVWKDQYTATIMESVQNKIDAFNTETVAPIKTQGEANSASITNINDRLSKARVYLGPGDSLPTENISEDTFYYKPVATNEQTDTHKYDVYTYHDGAWEKLNSASLDLAKLEETFYTKTQSDAAHKTFTDSISTLQSSVSTNANNISGINTKITAINEKLANFDGNVGKYYRATYTTQEPDTTHTDTWYLYQLWQYDNEDDAVEGDTSKATEVSRFELSGGGGGSSNVSTITITRSDDSPAQYVVLNGDKVLLKFTYNSVDSAGEQTDSSTAVVEIDGTVVMRNIELIYGQNEIDITKYVSVGTHRVTLTCTDSSNSMASRRWTVKNVDIALKSDFDDTMARPQGDIAISYIPVGAIDKTVHFAKVIDGVETEIGTVNTSNSGTTEYYTITGLTYGFHLIKMWITATVNGVEKSTKDSAVYKGIIVYDQNATTQVIGTSQQYITMKQYSTVNIKYTVEDPFTATPTVVLSDGTSEKSVELETNTNVWSYKATEIGDKTLTITVTDNVSGNPVTTTLTIHVTVTELGINFKKVNATPKFEFNPVGKSNSSETDKNWTYEGDRNIKLSVSDNFDWINGGYLIDDSTGDQYFCVKAGTRAYISCDLFKRDTDITTDGMDFKIIFKTMNVQKADTQILKCYDNTETAGVNVGLEMRVHYAFLRSSANHVFLNYSENDAIELDFNINKSSTAEKLMLIYEDGVASSAKQFTSADNFNHKNVTTPIEIGSDDCDVWIYRMRYYPVSISDEDVITEFISDARSAEEMVDRYTRNQIYDNDGKLTPESVANACPDLRVIKIDVPRFTKNKKDYVKNANVQCIYKNGDPVLDNWYWQNGYVAGRI